MIVAVQGELGSNSELAAREYFGGAAIDILPCRTFADLFAAVTADDSAGTGPRADAAMAPVENSLAGSIHDVWDLLAEHPVPVRGEIRLRIVHCLVGLPGASLRDVRRVRSHPQALAQCRPFLRDMDDVLVEEVYDTAGAVEIIKEEGRVEEAAIASAQAAADHGMQVLAEDLSVGDNFTRFLVLGEGADPGGTPKTTLILELAHTAAALPAVLDLLAGAGVEVLKVETRKRQGRPWGYGVYLEFAGGIETRTTAALEEIGRIADDMRLVGTYASGLAAEPRLHRR